MYDQVNTNLAPFNYHICNKTVLPSSCFNALRNDGINKSVLDNDNFSLPRQPFDALPSIGSSHRIHSSSSWP
jgi:hypothetical protein